MMTGEVTVITLSQHHVCLLLGLAIYLGRTHGYILQVVQVPPVLTQLLKLLYAYRVLHNLMIYTFLLANIQQFPDTTKKGQIKKDLGAK